MENFKIHMLKVYNLNPLYNKDIVTFSLGQYFYL